MRTAAVVIPIATIATAAGLTAYQLYSRRPPRVEPVAPRQPCVPVAAAIPAPPPSLPHAPPPKYSVPVGNQFLGGWSDLLLAKHDGPHILFMLSAAELNDSRYGWYMPKVAQRMANELASVLDDGCTGGCSPGAEAARTAAHTFADNGPGDGATQTRAWVKEDETPRIHMHRLSVRSRWQQLGDDGVAIDSIDVDVTCTCESWTIGMRMWNDVTTCDATLRDKGRVLATYRPRVALGSGKEISLFPLQAWDQTVVLPGGATLVTETGWNYTGDDAHTPRKRTTLRTGPHWR
jgi:hypothetical protein